MLTHLCIRQTPVTSWGKTLLLYLYCSQFTPHRPRATFVCRLEAYWQQCYQASQQPCERCYYYLMCPRDDSSHTVTGKCAPTNVTDSDLMNKNVMKGWKFFLMILRKDLFHLSKQANCCSQPAIIFHEPLSKVKVSNIWDKYKSTQNL